MPHADLEIGIHRREGSDYAIELRFNRHNDEVDNRESATAQFDFEELRRLEGNPRAYGRRLSDFLFADPVTQQVFSNALAIAREQAQPQKLRVRLFIGSSAQRLNNLKWETLTFPKQENSLCASDFIFFSRYLSSRDWRPVRLRPKGDLKALVVVANPQDDWQDTDTRLDVDHEFQIARDHLGLIAGDFLPGQNRRATVTNLIDCLRDGKHDILYLVCHGVIRNEEPWLRMENEDGQVEHVSGVDLVARLQNLPELPRLVVLLSCQSGGRWAGDVLMSVGAKLIEAGVPAVLAMQGNFSVETAARFMPGFFQQLKQHGQIDQAISIARSGVSDRLDAWVPVLFTRLRSGRVWYEPGFGESPQQFHHWVSLREFIESKSCTPIIGAGLTEPWIGQQSEIARRWAETHDYPLADQDFENLPRIAQYIHQRESSGYLYRAYLRSIRLEILRRYQDHLPPDLVDAPTWTPEMLMRSLSLATDLIWPDGVGNPYRQLAKLRLPIYITTCPTNFLAEALEKEKARPQVRICPWWDQDIPRDKWFYDDTPNEREPLVYHLFGHLSTPESLVLSEDQYMDFLIGFMQIKNKKKIPDAVTYTAFINSALLFLGFRTDEFAFRVLFRTLMSQGGSMKRGAYNHVTAQVEPEEGRMIDTQRARLFIEKAFNRENINIYWGRSEEFLEKLSQQMKG